MTPHMTRALAPACRPAQSILKAAGPHWRAAVTAGVGATTILDPDRPTTGDGARPNAYLTVPCRTEAVRLSGPHRQRAVAYWLSFDDGASWKVEGCWTWTDGHMPRAVSVTDLRAVVALPWAAHTEQMRRAA